MELQSLQKRIETARKKLHVLTERYNGQLSHPHVIRQSVRLDKLINEYNQFIKNSIEH
ncbi:aspartyl-phosphate phosphatase Spo0E family protein [Paenibacillus sanguinis]|uniref:aspartyl-phosphate phosphatase Spo0E family protein n=1 Tax=Paenibacillus sanguinis TaxID=225906 RepID=UPI0003643984|nr:aspartyl-phosphate phosphatase Spo0E family protein [Paenibacillus sanguinis]